MRILRTMLRQDAIYWHPRKRDQFGNIKEYELPVDIKCRWEDELVNGIDQDGRETVFMSTVDVDRDVVIEGMLLEGLVKDLLGPLPPPEAKKIRKFERLGTLKRPKTQKLRTAYL